MKRTLYLLALSILTSSCATVMNQPHQAITVYTTEPGTIIYNQDTAKTSGTKAQLKVERRDEVLLITTATDGITKSIEVLPRNSFMYWANICNYGIGMLVDRKNPKRYSYPQRIYINSSDTLSKYFRYGQSDNKGELLLHLSLPHINSFYLTPEDETAKVNTGFWGLTIGLDYYHSTNQFVNIGISGVSDFFVPFPAAVDISGEYEVMSSRYIGLSNNHKIRRFTVGYGLSYTKNTWDFRFYDRFDPPPPTRAPVTKSDHAFGLIFPAYLQMGEHFNMGIIYRPTFYRPNSQRNFSYEHLISLDFAWKIRLKK